MENWDTFLKDLFKVVVWMPQSAQLTENSLQIFEGEPVCQLETSL